MLLPCDFCRFGACYIIIKWNWYAYIMELVHAYIKELVHAYINGIGMPWNWYMMVYGGKHMTHSPH